MIVIVDYGLGNLGSIRNMFKKIGFEATITSDPDAIRSADKLVLPGVGSFDAGMSSLHDMALIPVLEERVIANTTPILGICLGMQLMTRSSEEGDLAGLGWVEAQTQRFNHAGDQLQLKIPHMGWNIAIPDNECLLFKNMSDEARFYFVHSYHVVCAKKEDAAATTHYGYEFVSAFQKSNIFGVQFHPEKSHKFGMELFKNFAELLHA